MKTARLRWIGAVLVVATSWGCSRDVQRPNWLNPGPTAYQRYKATEIADPYPLPDVGPEVVGGRPPSFQKPVPEVQRARQYSDRTRVSSRPSMYAAPPLTVTPPSAPAVNAPGAGYAAPVYTAPPAFSQPY